MALRNLSHQAPKTSGYPATSSSATVEEKEGGAKPAVSDAPTEPVLMGGASEKNRNCINFERQQAQSGMLGLDGATPAPLSVVGGGRALHTQLTQEDLETPKLDLSEVQRNLRESSDESLMEHSQKQFSSGEAASSRGPFYSLADTNADITASQVATPTSVLPKQQNVPKRPSSLSLHSKPAASLRMKFGKLGKSNLKKADVGVAKTRSAPEPRPVKVVANNAVTSIMANLTAQVPPGSTVSPAESQDKDGVSSEEMSFGILTASPDEQEPLLRRDAQLENNNTNNNNSNNNGGDGEGDGETDSGAGESGETGESAATVGETSSSSVTEPPAPPPPRPVAPPMDTPQPNPVALTQGEALLRQNRGRRPERPNSLDLSVTTLPLLGM